MDKWAITYGEKVSFVCVCCQGPQLARTFASKLRLQHCYNTWIDDEDDMPTWGQLGCNGFIVIDGSDNVICDATAAYLEVREDAFTHVEQLLDSMLGAQKDEEQQPSKRGRVDPAVGGSCAEVCFDKNTSSGEQSKAAETGTKNDNTDVPVQAVASVKVDVLDEEHRECESRLAALDALVVNGCDDQMKIETALRAVLSSYETHFAHEERMLDTHLYADVVASNASGGFSADKGARTSHFADHKMMISNVQKLLADVSTVDAASVLHIRRDFERHATQYDGQYADRLSSALAAKNEVTAQG